MKFKSANLPAVIIECANTHGGDKSVLYRLVEESGKYDYPNKAIKFQLFSPQTLALSDFSWYEVYKEIAFDENIWFDVIPKAKQQVGKVWLDIFDIYGIDILKKTISHIDGIKLQASVLENYEVRAALGQVDVRGLNLILNISGFELSQIYDLLHQFESLEFKEIILQMGYQAYPTKIEDSSLQKIQVLRAQFSNSICIADHVDANNSEAYDVPVYALSLGCDYIEKHICIKRADAKYDFYSSLEVEEFPKLFEKIKSYLKATRGSFICEAEKEYLKKSVQVPVTSEILEEGTLIGLRNLKFRRTDQKGLTYSQIQELQNQNMVLRETMIENKTFQAGNFRPAKIGVIVAGRLKSSRLKRKALLPIQGMASIERCLQSCLQFPYQDIVVLATSTVEEDAELENYTLDGKAQFFKGDPDDVIARYVGVCDKYNLDVIIRVTADCPLVSAEVAKELLESHFASGADFTAPKKFAVGTNCEIINANAMRKIIKLMGRAEYSEYMSFYFHNNPKYFKLNFVDLPESLIRDYRLTLDFEEDLQMFEQLYSKLDQNNLAYSTNNVFDILDSNPEISKINAHIQLKYKTDTDLINKLNKSTKIDAE